MKVPGLRSPYQKIGGLVYFGRMLDKIRLHADGNLPTDYQPNLGKGFDGRCVRFLHVDYDALRTETLSGRSDEEMLAWAYKEGRKPSDEEIEIWNEFMRKVGYADAVTPTLQRRLNEGGFDGRADIQTIFDYIDLDEGQDPQMH